MLKTAIGLVFTASMLWPLMPAFAQTAGINGKVIFEDDFSGDTIGHFPVKWHLSVCNERANYDKARFCKVIKTDDGQALKIPDLGRPIFFEPNTGAANYPGDSFTIEFDFLLESRHSCFGITYPHAAQTITYTTNGISLGHRGVAEDTAELHYVAPQPDKFDVWGIYPRRFNNGAWHHITFSNYRNEISGYLDEYRLIYTKQSNYHPHYFSLQLIGPIEITNFRLTGGKPVTVLSKLLSENKLVTHAILFDVNKSILKPESMDFINQLAAFLKTNPSIKLEIGGYTDSDGDSLTNETLSAARAEEVRKQLVSKGIGAQKLSTKGFGATAPLKPNTTPENKAENRRVEFVKQ